MEITLDTLTSTRRNLESQLRDASSVVTQLTGALGIVDQLIILSNTRPKTTEDADGNNVLGVLI